MDVLIIAHFTQAPDQHGNGRFHYIANMLSKRGVDVEIISTKFSHDTKSNRIISAEEYEKVTYKFTMIDEPGYKLNVSLKRFYSHYVMSKNLKKHLMSRKKPDVIYCAIPSLDVGIVMAKYAKYNKIRYIIDIQDLWPEAFGMLFRIPILKSIIFLPFNLMANRIYKSVDDIVSVSNTYSLRTMKNN